MKSLRTQLLLILSGFILISVFTAWYTSYFYKKRDKIRAISTSIMDFEIKLLKSIKEQENYFNFDISNENYFKRFESEYLNNFKKFHSNLIRETDSIIVKNHLDNSSIEELHSLKNELIAFDSLFQSMILKINKRGFKNYGLEGKMRESIHYLEKIEELELADILMLRRHEKDFILRQDPIYIELHAAAIEKLSDKILTNNNLNEKQKQNSITTLLNYSVFFNELASLEKHIGLKSNLGLKKKIDYQIDILFKSLEKLQKYSSEHQLNQLNKQNIYIFSFWTLYLIIIIIICISIAKRFTKRIGLLSNRINYFVNTNFTSRLKNKEFGGNDEVTLLWKNIQLMEKEIVDYISLFKEKVDEKTLELSHKNDKIEAQKKELEKEKKDLTDGMKYGWKLQSSLLPSNSRLEKQIRKGFVFFSPKDIVSGDVYWTHKTLTKEGEESIFSVIDCTGHGVPGAFMSILALMSINEAVLNKRHKDPNFIMQETNNYVFKSLKYNLNSEESLSSKDGMDMIICNLNRSKNRLKYSGAHRSLFIVRTIENNEDIELGIDSNEYKIIRKENKCLFEIYPSKHTVGTLNKENCIKFIQKTVKVNDKDMIYLCSDGFADQFGGPKNKKFMTKNFKTLLISIHNLSLNEKKSILKSTFYDWKSDYEQIDDVSILAVEV